MRERIWICSKGSFRLGGMGCDSLVGGMAHLGMEWVFRCGLSGVYVRLGNDIMCLMYVGSIMMVMVLLQGFW